MAEVEKPNNQYEIEELRSKHLINVLRIDELEVENKTLKSKLNKYDKYKSVVQSETNTGVEEVDVRCV